MSVDWNLIVATAAVDFERLALVGRSDTDPSELRKESGGCMGGRGFLGRSAASTTRSVLVGGEIIIVATKCCVGSKAENENTSPHCKA